jgi:hypothetical protein
MCRPCSRCSLPRYAMCKCPYREQAVRASLRWMVRKTADGTATTKYLRRRTRSKCSNPSRIRKIVLDPSSAHRMRRRITSTTNNLARPCSNNPRPSSVYPLHHRRRQTNTVVPRYNIRPRGQKRIRKWSYRRGRRPTSSRQHGRHMHLPGHCLLISPSCYYRRRTSTLLLHAVWALCSCDTNARQTFDNIISLWLLAWAAWTLF